MLGDRDDESEAMQTDVVSHDQVYLQFPEENIMSQHSETSHQQVYHYTISDVFFLLVAKNTPKYMLFPL
jgi:hypothetical protein